MSPNGSSARNLLIHNNCTTGVEAYLLGKTAISYRPLCDPRFDLLLPNALSAEAFELEQLLELGGAGPGRRRRSPAPPTLRRKADLARRFIANFDGKRACERMLDALDAIDLPEEALSCFRRSAQGSESDARNGMRSAQAQLRRPRVCGVTAAAMP